MKVLHLINYTGGGGTENYIFSLIRSLNKKNCEIMVAYSEAGDGLEVFETLNVELIHLPMKSSHDIAASRKLKKICKEKQINVIHTHFLRENYIAIISKWLGNKVKVVNTRHMLDKNTGNVKKVNRFMTKFNDSIIAVSKAVEDILNEELGKRDNIRLVYTGVDLDFWKKENSIKFRKEFDIDEDTVLVTSTARFSKEKGHEFLLKSIKYFYDRAKEDNLSLPKLKFILVGHGPLLEDMISLSKDLGIYEHIIFTGFRTDIRSILDSSDIFLSTSIMESFGISIIEAMAMELPVISTDSGGTREIISNYDNGFLFDYGDSDTFYHMLYDFVTCKDKRITYGKKGLETVKTDFNINNMAKKTYEIYKN